MVKYLVRAGAKIASRKRGRSASAIEAARSLPDIVRWLLVERHLDQTRLEYFVNGIEEQEVCAWSGVQCVEVETVGLYSQAAEGSSFDHAVELGKLRRQLQGV